MVINMRLLSILFFFFLMLHSYFVFAQDAPSSGGVAPNPNCPITAGTDCVNAVTVQSWSSTCASNSGWAPVPAPGVCGTGHWPLSCANTSSCVCEAPYKFQVSTVEGVTQGACVPDTCPNGLPKVNGQCPVCPTGFNEDGTCKDESTSSAAASSAASSVATSKPSDGEDGEDGEDGNDGGDGNGGNNNGGGSASSAASSQSGGAASSAASSGKGQCDPTAKNYLACIGSEKMNGDATDWEPVSANGNWLPVNENSPCVNKYQDSSGQWWCAAPSTNTPSSTPAGACDPTSTNYASCINSGATSSSGSSSSGDAEGLSNTGDQLIDALQQDIDSELTDFEQAYTDDIDAFKRDGVPFSDEPSAIKSVLISFLPVSTSCNPPKLEFFGNTYDLDCYYFDVFKQALGWFLAIITAFQIWQMAIRPVER